MPTTTKSIRFKLQYNPTWEEYQVRVYVDGVYNEERSYFALDKQDAVDTMAAMKKEVAKNPNEILER